MPRPDAYGKVAEVARVLEVDPVFLLGKVLAENDTALLDVISSVMVDRLITANEMALIDYVRKAPDGHDVSLVESPELLRIIAPALNAIFKREQVLGHAPMD